MTQRTTGNREYDWSRGNFPTWMKMLVAVAAVLLFMLIVFRVRTFEVSGNVHYTPEQIAEASGITEGDILMGVNRTSTAGRLLVKLPYLTQVVVQKSLPGTVRFHVVECQASGEVLSEFGTYWLISDTGKLLEEKEEHTAGFPTITGTVLSLPIAGDNAAYEDEAKGEKAMELLKIVQAAGLSGKITEINVAESDNICLIYDSRLEIQLGTGDRAGYALEYLKAVLNQLPEDAKGAIDMSFSSGDEAIFHPIA